LIVLARNCMILDTANKFNMGKSPLKPTDLTTQCRPRPAATLPDRVKHSSDN
jgi:hypothetical protein